MDQDIPLSKNCYGLWQNGEVDHDFGRLLPNFFLDDKSTTELDGILASVKARIKQAQTITNGLLTLLRKCCASHKDSNEDQLVENLCTLHYILTLSKKHEDIKKVVYINDKNKKINHLVVDAVTKQNLFATLLLAIHDISLFGNTSSISKHNVLWLTHVLDVLSDISKKKYDNSSVPSYGSCKNFKRVLASAHSGMQESHERELCVLIDLLKKLNDGDQVFGGRLETHPKDIRMFYQLFNQIYNNPSKICAIS